MSNELLENNLNNINMQNGSTITRTKIKLFNGKGNKAIGIFATADDFSNGMVTVDELIVGSGESSLARRQGNTFYVVDLNKYDNNFIALRSAGLAITTYTYDTTS